MKMNSQAIGIFDSGVGGLTVVRAIKKLLPGEDIIYFGDTARVPYGNKSPQTVLRYARQIAEFLIKSNVKAIAVACNTATAHALSTLQSDFPLPILGVIEPGAEAALAATRSGSIGIMGTVGTIQSGAYQKALLQRKSGLQLTALSAPLLVALIEENWLDHPATKLVLEEYLAPFQAARIDTLILACTHYPLLKEQMKKILGHEITLVDSAENIALALADRLQKGNLLNLENGRSGKMKIYVSDRSLHFESMVKNFLGENFAEVEQVQMLDT